MPNEIIEGKIRKLKIMHSCQNSKIRYLYV